MTFVGCRSTRVPIEFLSNGLKIYFHGQYLDGNNISSQFLYNILKLYFYGLGYILPIVNKLNTIYQGDYATVHLVYKDVPEMFMPLVVAT